MGVQSRLWNEKYGGMDPESYRLAIQLYENIFLILAKRRYTSDEYAFGSASGDILQPQEGGLLPIVFTEDGVQEGDGLGSIFGRLFRIFAPVAKSAAKSLVKHGVRTAVNVVGDVAQGHDWKEAGKRRLEETGENIIGQLQQKVNNMVGSGYPPEVLNKYGKVVVYCPMPRATATQVKPNGIDKRAEATRQLLSIDPPSKVIRRDSGAVKRKHSECRTESASKRIKKSKKKKKKNKDKVKKKKVNSDKKKRRKHKRKKSSEKTQSGKGYDQWL